MNTVEKFDAHQAALRAGLTFLTKLVEADPALSLDIECKCPCFFEELLFKDAVPLFEGLQNPLMRISDALERYGTSAEAAVIGARILHSVPPKQRISLSIDSQRLLAEILTTEAEYRRSQQQ